MFGFREAAKLTETFQKFAILRFSTEKMKAMGWVKLFSSQQEALERLKENTPFTVAIDARRICLIRNTHGIFAFKAYCPHAGASLSDAFCNAQNEIVCPLHGHRFELRTGREITGNSEELYLYPLQINENGVFLGLK